MSDLSDYIKAEERQTTADILSSFTDADLLGELVRRGVLRKRRGHVGRPSEYYSYTTMPVYLEPVGESE